MSERLQNLIHSDVVATDEAQARYLNKKDWELPIDQKASRFREFVTWADNDKIYQECSEGPHTYSVVLSDGHLYDPPARLTYESVGSDEHVTLQTAILNDDFRRKSGRKITLGLQQGIYELSDAPAIQPREPYHRRLFTDEVEGISLEEGLYALQAISAAVANRYATVVPHVQSYKNARPHYKPGGIVVPSISETVHADYVSHMLGFQTFFFGYDYLPQNVAPTPFDD